MGGQMRNSRDWGMESEDVRAQERFTGSLAALADILRRGQGIKENRRATDRQERRQPDGEAAA